VVSFADRDDAVSELVNSGNVAARWETFDLRTRREIVDALMVVKVLPATAKGKRFDPASIAITWRV